MGFGMLFRSAVIVFAPSATSVVRARMGLCGGRYWGRLDSFRALFSDTSSKNIAEERRSRSPRRSSSSEAFSSRTEKSKTLVISLSYQHQPTPVNNPNMMKLILLTSLLSVANCWTEQRSYLRNTQLRNHLSDENFNPCWQDLYDDDCSMDAVYQSSFVASEWLKSMPCASGIEVSNAL